MHLKTTRDGENSRSMTSLNGGFGFLSSIKIAVNAPLLSIVETRQVEAAIEVVFRYKQDFGTTECILLVFVAQNLALDQIKPSPGFPRAEGDSNFVTLD